MSVSITVDDLHFRRCGDDGEYAVIAFNNENIGSVLCRPDVASADPRHVFIVHLWNDPKGPTFIEDQREVRSTIVDLLIRRDLVPSAPPPAHPHFAGQKRRAV